MMSGNTVKKRPKHAGILIFLMVLALILSWPATAVSALPDEIKITVGQSQPLWPGWPFTAVENGSLQVLASGDDTLGGAVLLNSNQTGSADVTLSFLGLFPVKTIKVEVKEKQTLIPGGLALGVAMNTNGVLVVGTSDLSGTDGQSPARLAGVEAGDFILTVNGENVTDSATLSRLIEKNKGGAVTLGILREGQQLSMNVVPKKDTASGTYRLGAWVRDSTAGVGTLTYYNPESGVYGALGHAITDGDTGRLLSVRNGEVMRANVVDVKKGQKGVPGELKGSFLSSKIVLGNVKINTTCGIFGFTQGDMSNPLYPKGLPVGLKDSVHTGAASILSTIEGEEIREYQIEIIQVNRQSTGKSMVLRVTDSDLLLKTGGIVQGMSGSPILQDGHIVGAVTHVFISDPTRGYGIFIETMMAEGEKLE